MTIQFLIKIIPALYKRIVSFLNKEKTNIQAIQKNISNIKFKYILTEIYNGSLQNYKITAQIPLTCISSSAQLSLAKEGIKKELHHKLKSNTNLIYEFKLVKESIDQIDNILTNYFGVSKFRMILSSLKNFINDVNPYNNTIFDGYRSLMEHIFKYFPINEEIIWQNLKYSLKKEGRWGGMLVRAHNFDEFLALCHNFIGEDYIFNNILNYFENYINSSLEEITNYINEHEKNKIIKRNFCRLKNFFSRSKVFNILSI